MQDAAPHASGGAAEERRLGRAQLVALQGEVQREVMPFDAKSPRGVGGGCAEDRHGVLAGMAPSGAAASRARIEFGVHDLLELAGVVDALDALCGEERREQLAKALLGRLREGAAVPADTAAGEPAPAGARRIVEAAQHAGARVGGEAREKGLGGGDAPLTRGRIGVARVASNSEDEAEGEEQGHGSDVGCASTHRTGLFQVR